MARERLDIFSIKPYSFTDEASGEVKRGCTIEALGGPNDLPALGRAYLKFSGTMELFQSLQNQKIPGTFDCEISIKMSQNKAVMKLISLAPAAGAVAGVK